MIPEFLLKRLENEYTEDEVQKIISGLSSNIKTTFRVNNLKANNEEVEKVFNEKGIKFSKVDFYDKAYILESEFDLKSLDLFKEGKIYLQSLSSMMPPLMLEPKEGENILDMCAAPR